MGFYERRIFSRIMDAAMRSPTLGAIRADALASASGRVLELGIGTALNAVHYPRAVTELVGVDTNRGMERAARRRIADASMPVELRYTEGGPLPFDTASFATVVTTWTLCSVREVGAALAELRRVLEPDGRFCFVEHGLAPDPSVRRWQHRLDPIQSVLACGCHLDRDIAALVGESFRIETMKRFYVPGYPKVAGYFYQGVGRPA